MPIYLRLALLALTLFKLWLVAALPLFALGDARYDELVFLQAAESLLRGDWLGHYDSLTLIKGPGYPLWLALNYLLGVPLLVSQQALYLAAGLWLVAGLQRLHPRLHGAWLLLYAVYALNPMLTTQLLRDGLYPTLTIALLAALLWLYLLRAEPLRRLVRWSLFTGFLLGLFWLTREEGVWLVPALIWLWGGILWALFRQFGLDRRWLYRSGLLLGLPLLTSLACVHGVALLNAYHYGVYQVVELNNAPFKQAYAALLRVQGTQAAVRYLDLPASTRAEIYAVSPTFAELRETLEGPLLAAWQQPLICQAYQRSCKDIPSSWLIWALRDAVATAGYYRNAPTAAAYYQRLTREIESACTQGQLTCAPPGLSLLPPLRAEHVPLIIQAFWGGIRFLSGWTQVPDSLALPLTRLDTASRHYFLASLTDPGGYARPMQSNGNPEHLARFAALTHMRLATTTPSDLPRQQRLQQQRLALLAVLNQTYAHAVPWLTLLALAAYLLSSWRNWQARRFSWLWLLNSALLGAIVSRLVLLAVIDACSFPAIHPQYLLPLYPLLYLWLILPWIDVLSLVRGRPQRYTTAPSQSKHP